MDNKLEGLLPSAFLPYELILELLGSILPDWSRPLEVREKRTILFMLGGFRWNNNTRLTVVDVMTRSNHVYATIALDHFKTLPSSQ